MTLSKTVRKIIWAVLVLGACVLLWVLLVKPLSGKASISGVTVTKASDMQPEFEAMLQDHNGLDRVRLDDSKQAIPNDPTRYSIFRYTVRVTNPSFKDARDIQFRLRPMDEAVGRFLVMNRYPTSLKVYAHDSSTLGFNVLVETRGLTQQQIEALKGKIRLEVTWTEGFWVRSSEIKLVE